MAERRSARVASKASNGDATSDAKPSSKPKKAGIAAWVAAARPKTLTAATVPFLVGSALATTGGGEARWAEATCALVGYFFIQIGTNLVNDACDFVRGADTEVSRIPSIPHRSLHPKRRPRFSPCPIESSFPQTHPRPSLPLRTQDRAGPKRVTQSGAFSSRTVHIAGVACFILAAVAMYPAVVLRGVPMLRLVCASCAAGYAYTGGPFPLGYHGLGDVTVIVFFGFVATCGMARIHHGAYGDGGSTSGLDTMWGLDTWGLDINGPLVVASAQVGSLAAVLLAVNNLRDARTDARCGKNTLCVLLGERFGRWEITFLLAAPFTLLPYWAWEGARRLEVTMFPSLAAALPAATAPLAAWVGGEAWRLGVGDAGFNGALTGAAALHLLFGAALALGLALDGVAWRDSFDSSIVSEVREAASASAAALS